MPAGGGRDRLADLLGGPVGVAQQRHLGHPGVVAGRDVVQVTGPQRQARVGPHLVAGRDRHARAGQRPQRGRPRPQAGQQLAVARRGQVQHASHRLRGAALRPEVGHPQPAGQARRRQHQVGARLGPAPRAQHVQPERGVRRPVRTRVSGRLMGRHAARHVQGRRRWPGRTGRPASGRHQRHRKRRRQQPGDPPLWSSCPSDGGCLRMVAVPSPVSWPAVPAGRREGARNGAGWSH